MPERESLLKEVRELRARLEQLVVGNSALKAACDQLTAELEEKNNLLNKNSVIIKAAKEQIQALREEIDKLSSPPRTYGQVERVKPDKTVDVFSSGRRFNVWASEAVDLDKLKSGQRVLLNEALNILEAEDGLEKIGDEAKVVALLDGGRVRVTTHLDEVKDVYLAYSLLDTKIREGDTLMIFGYFAYNILPKQETEEFLLEKVPDITYAQVGGLQSQIDILRKSIEYPVLYPELFKKLKLEPPKGILLYGPPGCGKTLLAKAVANDIAKRMREKLKDENIAAYFINIKGPELLTKWVGETERKIREIFLRAKEKAQEGHPVIIFFDEFESLFRMRGSGISSDVESTIVPQFLTMIDGVEGVSNVIVIGASNRQDLIDPAVLRPGRFDRKIKIDRPDKESAREIFRIYMTSDLPLGRDSAGAPYVGQKARSIINRLSGNQEGVVDLSTPERVVRHFIDVAADFLYYVGPPLSWKSRKGRDIHHDTRYLEVTWSGGETETLYVKDLLVSGAMIKSVVDRVKEAAMERMINDPRDGISKEDLYNAIRTEIAGNQDLPNTNNPDDWSRILGRGGKQGRIVNIRLLHTQQEVRREVQTLKTPGHYL